MESTECWHQNHTRSLFDRQMKTIQNHSFGNWVLTSCLNVSASYCCVTYHPKLGNSLSWLSTVVWARLSSANLCWPTHMSAKGSARGQACPGHPGWCISAPHASPSSWDQQVSLSVRFSWWQRERERESPSTKLFWVVSATSHSTTLAARHTQNQEAGKDAPPLNTDLISQCCDKCGDYVPNCLCQVHALTLSSSQSAGHRPPTSVHLRNL